ncbi:MAG: hypothetical protein UFA98_07550 [Ruminococcus sp.]|nr:hypothetical protein [Ruminococcus sp.]
MNEIGGYFGLEPLISNEYYKNLIALNTARNALLYVLKARNISRLYIPYYLCDSVSDVCEREGYDYSYYRVGRNFLPDFETDLGRNDYLYIVNYYGQISNDILLQLKEKYQNIIFDNVQAFFQKPVQGIDTIYSCRKFFGVPDGAYLSTDCFLEEDLPEDVSSGRLKHLLGRFETGSASNYYTDYKETDKSFNSEPLKKMSLLTHNLLGAIDYENVRKKREQNFNYLHEHLKEYNTLKLIVPQGAFTYPFCANNGMFIRKMLSAKRIYIPTLWPNVLNSDDRIAKEYATEILPLPCDQRYNFNELDEIIKGVVL